MFEPSFKLAENGIPVLSHNEIEKHAVEFVKSFAPECLKKPQSLDIERFAESYLELTLDFDYLSNDGSVLGRLVFNTTDEMPVYNPEKNLAEIYSGDPRLGHAGSKPVRRAERKTFKVNHGT